MRKKIFSRFSIILFIIGLMMAVQYNTVNEPDSRDTRDVWAIRQELSVEKKRHSELLSEIGQLDNTLDKYEAASEESPEQALKETVEELRSLAGLTETTGPGFEVVIEPSPEAVAFGQTIEGISPDLLIRFLNSINSFNNLEMSIDGNRLVNTSAIRDINGKTTVNTKPVQTPPFTVKIVAGTMEDAEKLSNYLLSSPLLDDFYIDDLAVTVSEIKEDMVIEAYDGKISNQYLKDTGGE
ncbi:uncharacterized protein YlxW (UPF0749 family) [Planomicrobium soli]|uniref:Uncharacterized protein YlxW (UPF0749 family) n=1 Tax=Planomicrobium soli TaxID=1176648 RepID=A0A2P8FSX3_9BACL|nr:DUF881 domain-containing protein [Planomicrobium soli]PSL24830.1 uncharacterized protein YlxW (UPF0749 family) [Planomicrobium soli]